MFVVGFILGGGGGGKKHRDAMIRLYGRACHRNHVRIVMDSWVTAFVDGQIEV